MKKRTIISWWATAKVTAENRAEEVNAMTPSHEIGDGAKGELEATKKIALEMIAILQTPDTKEFTVSLSGHSQADSPGSAPDSLSVSVSVVS